MDLANKSQLLDYLKKNDLWAKKGLSQNFLIDKDALNKIVAAAELKSEDLVVEIGPGTGILTSELIKCTGEVIAIEQDEKLAGLLPEITKSKLQITNKIQNDKNLKIISSDILKVNLNEVIGDRKYKVVANIPYHITSKILELFLSRENKPEMMVLLVQKEVAERICAKPGEMSVLAVSVQLYSQPEIVDVVLKESFFPSPKVDSAILKINKIEIGDKSFDEKEFFRCVHIGFAARRKTLANNLMVGYQLERQEVIDIIKKIGLKDTVRAQELDISNWGELCRKMTKKTT
jgi:16S rRNA (adenine1518-N6/adenine1519-N6)-dimethyltransferase